MAVGIKLEIPRNDIKTLPQAFLAIKKASGEKQFSIAQTVMTHLAQMTPLGKRERFPWGVRPQRPHLRHKWEVSKQYHTEGWIREIILQNTAPHANALLYLEYGTPPHEIHGNPLLVFKWHNKIIYTRRVRHPGTKPLHLLSIAQKELIDNVAAVSQVAAEEIAKWVSRLG